jgi:hypothetical protein
MERSSGKMLDLDSNGLMLAFAYMLLSGLGRKS